VEKTKEKKRPGGRREKGGEREGGRGGEKKPKLARKGVELRRKEKFRVHGRLLGRAQIQLHEAESRSSNRIDTIKLYLPSIY
jgi:hypothetical protein